MVTADTTAARPRITVLGAGSWGTALAVLMARNGHQVTLWARDAELAERTERDRINSRYLPEIHLPDGLHISSDLDRALQAVDQVWLVLPTRALAEFLTTNSVRLPASAVYVNAAKGFEPGSGRRISEMVARALGDVAFATVSGPTFAHEVAGGKPSAIAVASDAMDCAETVAACLRSDRLRAYTTNDVLGVELGGGLKNVLAIAAGVSDGFGFGANARAALITRGLAELMRLGESMGARHQTLIGLAGLGDLVLTCTDDQSRNRRFGLKLAQGYGIEEARAAIGQAVEGIYAAKEGMRLAMRYQADMPIVNAVHHVLFEDWSARDAVAELLAREPRPEGW